MVNNVPSTCTLYFTYLSLFELSVSFHLLTMVNNVSMRRYTFVQIYDWLSKSRISRWYNSYAFNILTKHQGYSQCDHTSAAVHRTLFSQGSLNLPFCFKEFIVMCVKAASFMVSAFISRAINHVVQYLSVNWLFTILWWIYKIRWVFLSLWIYVLKSLPIVFISVKKQILLGFIGSLFIMFYTVWFISALKSSLSYETHLHSDDVLKI